MKECVRKKFDWNYRGAFRKFVCFDLGFGWRKCFFREFMIIDLFLG